MPVQPGINPNKLTRRSVGILTAVAIGSGAVGVLIGNELNGNDRTLPARAPITATNPHKPSIAESNAAVQLAAEKQRATKSLRSSSIAAADSILSELDREIGGNYTSYGYSHFQNIENSAAVTASDNIYPQMLASYDSKLNEINIYAYPARMPPVEIKVGPDVMVHSTYVDIVFGIGSDSGFARRASSGGALTVTDFRNALTEPSLAFNSVATGFSKAEAAKHPGSGRGHVGILAYNGNFYVGDNVTGNSIFTQSEGISPYTPDKTNPLITNPAHLAKRVDEISTVLKYAIPHLLGTNTDSRLPYGVH